MAPLPRFFPCVALVIADGPEASRILGVYRSHQSCMPCRVCSVAREDLLCPTQVEQFRDGHQTLAIVQAAEKVRAKRWASGARRVTAAEKERLDTAKRNSLLATSVRAIALAVIVLTFPPRTPSLMEASL